MNSHPTNILIGIIQGVAVFAFLFLEARFIEAVLPGVLLTGFAQWASIVFNLVVCGGIVFGYPKYLYWHNRKKEAAVVLASTLVTIGVILAFVTPASRVVTPTPSV